MTSCYVRNPEYFKGSKHEQKFVKSTNVKKNCPITFDTSCYDINFVLWYIRDAIDSRKEVIKLASGHVFTYSDLKQLSMTVYCTQKNDYVTTPLMIFILENVSLFKYVWNKENAYDRLSEIFEQNGFVYRYTKLFSKYGEEETTEGYWTDNTRGDEFVYGVISLERLKELSYYKFLEMLGKKKLIQEFFELIPFDNQWYDYRFDVRKICEHVKKNGTQSLVASVLKMTSFVFGNDYAIDYDNRVIKVDYVTDVDCGRKNI